jgi:hypothetical protein
LEAVGVLAILRDRVVVFQDETDLNDASDTSGHQGVPENAMYHGTQMQFLGVTTHGPSSNGDDNGRDQVALGTATAIATEPDAQKASAPPNDTHGRVLQIVTHPSGPPSMFGESIDTSPRSNDHTVVELLRTAGATQPNLTYEKEDGVDDSVGDEGRAHDEVSCTLAGMVALTEAQGSDSAKEHLHPCSQRDDLAEYTVCRDNPLPNLAVEAALKMEPEVDAHGSLGEYHHH